MEYEEGYSVSENIPLAGHDKPTGQSSAYDHG